VYLLTPDGKKQIVAYSDKVYKGFPGGDRMSIAYLNQNNEWTHGISLPGAQIEEITPA